MIENLVLQSRSCRGYDESVHLTREQLEDFVSCARLCPSSGNKQPLRYYIAWEDADVAKILKCTKWAAALPQMHLPHEGQNPTAFIVICQDTSIDPDLLRYQRDVGIVAQTIMLRAVEEGYRGCMIGNFQASALHEALHLADSIRSQLCLALGKSVETVKLTDVPEDGNTNYYRDENDVHYVPKRKLEDLLLD